MIDEKRAVLMDRVMTCLLEQRQTSEREGWE